MLRVLVIVTNLAAGLRLLLGVDGARLRSLSGPVDELVALLRWLYP